ncbi:MAG TPA: ATP-binding protein [Chryseosolibacter sp.]
MESQVTWANKLTKISENNSLAAVQDKRQSSLLDVVFNTSTLALHVLQSVRDESGSIIDFQVILANATSEKMAGRKVDGMLMLEGWPHTKEIGLFDKFIDVVESNAHVDYEQEYNADGVRAYFRWLATKLDDGIYVTIEDITERKQNENALSETLNKLQSTFNGVPAIISLVSATQLPDSSTSFIVSSANQAMADFSGCAVPDLIGKELTELYPEVFHGALAEKFKQVLNDGSPFTTELFYPGKERWLSLIITRQTDGNGLVAAALDITEKKAADEKQRQIQVLKSLNEIRIEFFNNISHEFRTPLTLLLGPIEEILTTKSIPKLQLNKLEMAHRNALRLQKLVNSLLDFARIEAGRFDTVYQPTNICDFTAALASNFRSIIERAGLKFTVKCEGEQSLYINRNMWEKIVFNLLSNAFKFTFSGSIEIKIKENKKHVCLHVCDTGVGIESKNISKIFERFVRIENVKARTFEGSGIGLALVKELVTIHGGTLKVKSKHGSGSEFIVSLPKGKKHLPGHMVYEFNDSQYDSKLADSYTDELTGWIPKLSKRFNSAKSKTLLPVVLLVDDNSDLRQYITDILKFEFTVVEASNGKVAIDLLNDGLKAELILADVMMPEVNGYQLLQFVRSNNALQHIPFIFLSAKASEQDRIAGIRSGANHYIIKPFASEELRAIVKSKICSSTLNAGQHLV